MGEVVTGQDVPVDNHVVRTVGKDKWDFAEDGTTVVLESGVFLPRLDHPLGTGPEPYVSVDWLEHFAGSLREQLDRVRDAVAARRTSGKVGKHSRLGMVAVYDVYESSSTEGKTLSVRTTGDPNDLSHSGIYGLDPSDDKIAQEIARRCVAHKAYS